MYKKKDMSLPQGVKDVLPDEANKICFAEGLILDVFKKYGFERIVTPLIEYIDTLSLGLGPELNEKVFKFIEPTTGKVVAIRPDVTPQVARVAATRLDDMPLPLKLCYNEGVIRLQDPKNGIYKEILQVGCEYLTERQEPEVDAEIIIIAIEAMTALGLKDFKIDIGDVGFVRSIIEGLPVEMDELIMIKRAIALKDISSLESILSGLGGKVATKIKRCILAIPDLFGEDDIIKKAASLVWKDETKDTLEYLKKVLKKIDKVGLNKHVTIDLGEVRGLDYYTGIIFEGFAQGFGKPLMSGGRYDNLMGRYGYDSNATGFAFDLENLIAAME